MNKIKPGDLIRIKINKEYLFLRALAYEDFAFYDFKSKTKNVDSKEIISKEIVFKTFINTRSIEDGDWKVVDNIPLDENLKNSKYYLTDAIDPNYFRIYNNGKITNSTKEKCIGLEIHAIWDPIHIYERIKDYYLGKENMVLKVLDSLGNYKIMNNYFSNKSE